MWNDQTSHSSVVLKNRRLSNFHWCPIPLHTDVCSNKGKQIRNAIPRIIISNEVTSVNSRSGLCASMETSNLASWFSESSASKSSSNATIQHMSSTDWVNTMTYIKAYYKKQQAHWKRWRYSEISRKGIEIAYQIHITRAASVPPYKI